MLASGRPLSLVAVTCALALGCSTDEPVHDPAQPTVDTQEFAVKASTTERYEKEIALLQDHIATLEAELEESTRRIEELESLGDRERQATSTANIEPTRQTENQDDLARQAAIKNRLENIRAEINRLQGQIRDRSAWLSGAASAPAENRQAVQNDIERMARRVEQLEEQAFVLEQQLLARR